MGSEMCIRDRYDGVAPVGDTNGDGFDDVVMIDDGEDAILHFGGASGGLVASSSWVTGHVTDVSATDLNGDGYSDLIVGKGVVGTGSVETYHGGPSGPATQPDVTLQGLDDYYGYSVAGLTDLNSDGFGDVAIIEKAALDENGRGELFVHYGSPAGVMTSAAWSKEIVGVILAPRVSQVGDINGDGIRDLLLSTPGANVLLAQTPPIEALSWIPSNNPREVDVAGDVNGDGFCDLLVVSDSSTFLRYQVCLYYGSADGLAESARWEFPFPVLWSNHSSCCAGDLNGDGFDDLLVLDDQGAFLCFGSATGPVVTQITLPLVSQARAAGDVNGDGLADVVLYGGDYQARIHLGSRIGLSVSPIWSQQTGGMPSFADVNADGFTDAIIGYSCLLYTSPSPRDS